MFCCSFFTLSNCMCVLFSMFNRVKKFSTRTMKSAALKSEHFPLFPNSTKHQKHNHLEMCAEEKLFKLKLDFIYTLLSRVMIPVAMAKHIYRTESLKAFKSLIEVFKRPSTTLGIEERGEEMEWKIIVIFYTQITACRKIPRAR